MYHIPCRNLAKRLASDCLLREYIARQQIAQEHTVSRKCFGQMAPTPQAMTDLGMIARQVVHEETSR